MKSKWSHFNYMVNEIDSVYHDMAVKMGITDSEFLILYVLNENDNYCNQSEIYKNSGISRKTINSAIQKMRKSELLTVEQADGRNTLIRLTDIGLSLANHVLVPIIKIENDILDEWSQSEINIYHELTQKYLNMIKEKAKALNKKYEKGNITIR